MNRILVCFLLLLTTTLSQASYILLPMDENQDNHLKSYGITYWVLNSGGKADWLLNYRGGAFVFKYVKSIESECVIRGVTYEVLADAQYARIVSEIANPEVNMDLMKLDKPPKVAVYSPKNKLPWDDAVTLVLTYAEIPYDLIYDDEVMGEELAKYDWLHLHHEDFTGQYGKFWHSSKNAAWYKENQRILEATAAKHGFEKVSELKLSIAHKIRDYVTGGGFLFAMCSATDTYDIALAAEGIDICQPMFDGDAMAPGAHEHLDFTKTFAFKEFRISTNPSEYEHSNIDVSLGRKVPVKVDYFTLFDFSAKWDPVPTMLTQCHTQTVKGFYGQTTAFKKSLIKSNVLLLGENKAANEARYIHGEFGYGTWTFYGGHDPEDYKHYVGDPPTDLNLHPNSPGYRLILNNILFPAAKKKNQKT
ncbi:MAG: hypothetical protein ACI959_000735 [Limisphaerales bacterium]|jgi:hypothetical protein